MRGQVSGQSRRPLRKASVASAGECCSENDEYSGSAPSKPLEAAAAARPIIKWVGGKGRLLPQLRTLLPPDVDRRRHVEPFAGGAALFFDRNPKRALLADVNDSLMHMYRAICHELATVVHHLSRLAKRHDKETYYATRERYNRADKASPAERAAMFIYLNKTCFNGLHRVNREGHFNVPIGRYSNPRILDWPALHLAREVLQRTELRCGSFEVTCAGARRGDFVYLDPPYAPVSSTANFTSYASQGFGEVEQVRLRDVFRELDAKGCAVMLSNSDTPLVRALYSEYRIDKVSAPRSVNSRADRRGRITELVVRNYR